jgi:hypothetical protein
MYYWFNRLVARMVAAPMALLGSFSRIEERFCLMENYSNTFP